MKQYSEFYQGLSRSKSDQKGFYSLANCDVHGELGVLRNN